jgi:D-glycero-D-manno-heptose 1,7-bisphosphate phosphatase
MAQPLTPAVFLDRDGVILEHREGYVRSIAEAVFLPRALSALARLAATPYPIVIATNQALVGRGIIPLAEVTVINNWVVGEICRAGGRIDWVGLCPHHPDDGCQCRKPKPGMLVDAAAALNIDLSRSIMIGDAVTDLLAGQAAGAQPLMVRSGRGSAQEHLLAAAGLLNVPIFSDLAEVVNAIASGSLDMRP